MKVLVTGRGGQLAWELEQTCPKLIAGSDVEFISLDRHQLDISDKAAVQQTLFTHSPDIVINAAAYTAVDKAEANKETAYAVNDAGSEHLAFACKEIKARLIHVSTDFVFDGTKTTPYLTDDQPNPINVYGASKLAGDNKIAAILGNQATIIRTAWVYSFFGNNFVKTMLRLMADKPALNIVADQIGTPTWAKGLAQLIWSLVNQYQSEKPVHTSETEQATILHWTDAGIASWYDFAVAIQELALEKRLLKQAIPISPIPAAQYPTPATRPSFSVIDKSTTEAYSGVKTIHWRKQLSLMLDEILNEKLSQLNSTASQ